MGKKRTKRADRADPLRRGSVGPSTHTASSGDWWESNRALILAERLERNPAEHDVLLDLGCGSGFVISDEAGLDARFKVGIDAWRSSSWVNSDRSVFVVADVMKLPFRSGIADTIVTLDVIEHVDDDRAALAEAARVLRDGGLALVMVPAFELLWSNHDEAVGHFRRYRLRDLAGPMSDAGLRRERSSYFFAWLFPLALVRRVFRLGGKSDEAPRGLAGISFVFGRLERWCIRHRLTIPFGSSLFVEAVREERREPARSSASHPS